MQLQHFVFVFDHQHQPRFDGLHVSVLRASVVVVAIVAIAFVSNNVFSRFVLIEHQGSACIHRLLFLFLSLLLLPSLFLTTTAMNALTNRLSSQYQVMRGPPRLPTAEHSPPPRQPRRNANLINAVPMIPALMSSMTT
jgi:hypothetical protein